MAYQKKFVPKLFKWRHFQPDIILLYVRWYLSYRLSYRDLVEMMDERGLKIAHTTIMRWVFKFSFALKERVRPHLRRCSKSWRMDETYIRLNGKWVYLYRAVDSTGATVDFLLRAKRDKVAAKAFFSKAFKQHGRPDKVTVDKSGSNKSALDALNKELDEDKQFEIRQIKYLNNIVEQDHRFIKKRARPTLGFKEFQSAKKTIAGIENIRMIEKGQIFGYDSSKSTFENFACLMG